MNLINSSPMTLANMAIMKMRSQNLLPEEKDTLMPQKPGTKKKKSKKKRRPSIDEHGWLGRLVEKRMRSD